MVSLVRTSEIVDLYEQGYFYSEIASILNISESLITQRLNKLVHGKGFVLKKKRLEHIVIKRYVLGKTVTEICKSCNNKKSVYTIVRRYLERH